MKITPLLFAATLATGTISGASQAAPKVVVAPHSFVYLKASTDEKSYKPGQTIAVHLTATNNAKTGAYLRFSSGQRFDFSVYKSGKKETAYTWSAARMFNQMVGSLWLKPGQSQSFDATIGDEMGQLQPGKYRLEAHLTNSPRNILAAPVEFEVAKPALAVTAKTDKSSYKIGEPVLISAAVANTTATEQKALINWGMICDFEVADEAGNTLWNYGANLRFIRTLGLTTWEKGETKNASATWNGTILPGKSESTKLKPGRYRVRAVLATTPPQYSAPVLIDITE